VGNWANLIAATNTAVLATLGNVEDGATFIREDATETDLDADQIIFDNRHIPAQPGEAPINATEPHAFVLRSALPCDPNAENCQLRIDGVTYDVTEAQQTGEDGLKLMLKRAA
jgi:hypothetical protein